MDRESNVYTIGYAVIMTVIVAAGLSTLVTSLREKQANNEKLAAKIDILKAVGLDYKKDKITGDSIFNQRVESLLLDFEMNELDTDIEAVAIDIHKENKKSAEEKRYPLYVYRHDGQTNYIVPLYGNGLWDKIWGYLALEEDMSTVAGVSMDHKAETPGLGAEIKDSPDLYNEPFVGMSIYDEKGEYVSIAMKKGTKDMPGHQIDAITGATITSNGVNVMLYEDVKSYLAYFENNSK